MVLAFLRSERGAATLDWVAMTAGILVLGLVLVYALFSGGVSSISRSINATLENSGTSIEAGSPPQPTTFE